MYSIDTTAPDTWWCYGSHALWPKMKHCWIMSMRMAIRTLYRRGQKRAFDGHESIFDYKRLVEEALCLALEPCSSSVKRRDQRLSTLLSITGVIQRTSGTTSPLISPSTYDALLLSTAHAREEIKAMPKWLTRAIGGHEMKCHTSAFPCMQLRMRRTRFNDEAHGGSDQ
jgi:hypothetical protein